MGDTTKIQWCDYTVNFWEGCTKVSPGCTNCYAEARDKRHMIEDVDHWGKGAPRRKSKSAVALAHRLKKKPAICNCCNEAFTVEDSLTHRHGSIIPTFHRARVFSLSLGDWLDPEVPIGWLAEMLTTIQRCHNLDFLLCTKRPELWRDRVHHAAVDGMVARDSLGEFEMCIRWLRGHPPQNVWILTSTENQEMLDKRVPDLLKIPAVVHGLSCEPLLGPLDLKEIDVDEVCPVCGKRITASVFSACAHCDCCVEGDEPIAWHSLNWVISGGESGPSARPCSIEWMRSIQAQCQDASVPYFCKQLGSDSRCSGEVNSEYFDDIRTHTKDKKGADPSEWPEDMRVRQWPEVMAE